MADGVYAAVQDMKGSSLKPDVDCPTGDAGAEELDPPYNPVLSPPKLRQEPINAALSVMRPAFATYYVVNAGRATLLGMLARAGHPASVTGSGSRVARQTSRLRHEKGSNPALPPLALIP